MPQPPNTPHRAHIDSALFRVEAGGVYERCFSVGRHKVIRSSSGFEGWYDLTGRADDVLDLRSQFSGTDSAAPWVDLGKRLDVFEADLSG
jgi:hypothetical protein